MLVKLTNKQVKLGVIGSPVAHSLSPVIHNYMINELALNYIYLPFDVERGNAKKFLNAASLMGVTGFNVTMPHKQDIFSGVAEALGDARAAGSVNTAVLKCGRWLGYSTDGDGFNLSLLEKGVNVRGKSLVLLGAGGAARAVILSAKKNGAGKIVVLNRTAANAKALADSMGVEYGGLESSRIAAEFARADILVNSTPLGMHGIDQDFRDLSFLSAAPGIVCDLIYNPLRTELLKRAEQNGHLVINGLSMLIYQAILSLELFADMKIGAHEMKSGVEKYLLKNGYIH